MNGTVPLGQCCDVRRSEEREILTLEYATPAPKLLSYRVSQARHRSWLAKPTYPVERATGHPRPTAHSVHLNPIF